MSVSEQENENSSINNSITNEHQEENESNDPIIANNDNNFSQTETPNTEPNLPLVLIPESSPILERQHETRIRRAIYYRQEIGFFRYSMMFILPLLEQFIGSVQFKLFILVIFIIFVAFVVILLI